MDTFVKADLPTFLTAAGVIAHCHLRILCKVADPKFIGVGVVGHAIKVGDEGPNLGIGKKILSGVDWEVSSLHRRRHDYYGISKELVVCLYDNVQIRKYGSAVTEL